ncbi:MAG: hypothetical protein KBC22_00610 [Candidatus Pacebacteria bacterium]|nr:hypothetical protein [Candidatus Paceibacterota bacterium]
MSISDKILLILSSNPCAYKKLRRELMGTNIKEEVLPTEYAIKKSLTRLHNKGVIGQNNKSWNITPEGKELLQKGNKGLRGFFPKQKPSEKVTKEVLVFFDIPEKERYKRDWLRNELVGFGFEQIQRSVWFGPKLPKEFIKHIGNEEISQYVHIFKAAKNLFNS